MLLCSTPSALRPLLYDVNCSESGEHNVITPGDRVVVMGMPAPDRSTCPTAFAEVAHVALICLSCIACACP
jgi:hypothetical protein